MDQSLEGAGKETYGGSFHRRRNLHCMGCIHIRSAGTSAMGALSPVPPVNEIAKPCLLDSHGGT